MTTNPSTEHLMHWLEPNPRLDGVAAEVAEAVHDLATEMTEILDDGPELNAGLRKLREAKDCFVIQALEDKE